MRKNVIHGILILSLAGACTPSANTPKETVARTKAIVYLTAKNTSDRLARKDDLTYDSLTQPLENLSLIHI